MAHLAVGDYIQLHEAVSKGDVDQVKFYLNVKKVDPDMDHKKSLLFIACQNNNLDIVKLLITNKENPADPNRKHNNKDTPFAAVLLCNPINMDLVKLLLDVSIIKVDLDRIFCLPNYSLYIVTALTIAVQQRNLTLVEILLKAGADPNLKPGTGQAPLVVALLQQDVSMCKLLLEKQCNPNISVRFYDTNLNDYEENEAICVARTMGNLEIMQLLIKHGAEITSCRVTMMQETIVEDRAYILEYLLELLYCKEAQEWPRHGYYVMLAIQTQAIMCTNVLLCWGFYTHKSSQEEQCPNFTCAAQHNDINAMKMMIELKPQCLQENWLVKGHYNFMPLFCGSAAGASFVAELINARKQAPRLDILCRAKIIQELGLKPLSKVQKLLLPKSLKDFVQFQNVEGFCNTYTLS